MAPAQEPQAVRAWEDTKEIPTYVEGLPDPNPPFDYLRLGRVNYPYTIRNNLTDHREPRAWRALHLENQFLHCYVLPDLGGHLYSCIDKVSGEEMFYANPSIKLTQIGYRGAWAALGVEFNFPVSHNWMTTSPVDFAITTDADGSASVWIGNIDRVYGMQWLVQLTLRPGEAVLEQHTTLYNRSAFRHRFYWWSNAAVQVWDDSRIIYPMAYTASHGFSDVDGWPVDARGTDNSVVGNHLFGPVSRFSYGSREGYMAVYHPRTSAGVVHYSPPLDLPGKKIWSWGGDANGLRWRTALSDDNSAYVEIQAGVFRDQETYGYLEPRQALRFTEYWIPIRELDGLSRATPHAAVSLIRKATHQERTTIAVALNVTREFPEATVMLLRGRDTVRQARQSLTPYETFRLESAGLPAAAKYTVELRDSSGAIVLRHTEGEYDWTPPSEIRFGLQQPYRIPEQGERSEGDFAALGDLQERDGLRLDALATYQSGLRQYPNGLALARAAGRLAVTLDRASEGEGLLRAALGRVSNDYETAYYLGHAARSSGNDREARRHWENAQRYGTFRPAALFELAALTARQGDRGEAVRLLAQLAAEAPHDVRAGGMEVALLRALGRTEQAARLLGHWRAVDPTSSLLRYETTRLGGSDDGLWPHLAGDPERILELAVDYLAFGLTREALSLLERDFPTGAAVVTEPGMPHPSSYPLIAYYRGHARQQLGEDPAPDFAAASRMPTRYVFPNRSETFAVLRGAVARDSTDATAHFLLGSLYLARGLAEEAMAEWGTVRRLDPRMPGLYRNMGYTVLAGAGAPQQAAELFREGMRADAQNVGLYFGLDEALRRLERPATERADALLRYPDRKTMPAALVYLAARTLAAAQRFDEAEALFAGRFFPSEEGGTDVREVYLEVRTARARELATAGQCRAALAITDRLAHPVADLYFTKEKLESFLEQGRFQDALREVQSRCGGRRP